MPGHHLARSAIALELDHVEVALRIHCEQVDPGIPQRAHLPTQNEESVEAENAEVLLEDLFEPPFGLEARVLHWHRPTCLQLPEADLDGHGRIA